jgi:hypothetical protein
MKRDLPDFYATADGLLQTSRRESPRARLYRRRYRCLKRAAIVLPVVVAAISFGAFVWNEHQWRQRTVEQRIQLEGAASRVIILQRALAMRQAMAADERCEEYRKGATLFRWCRRPARGDS